MSTPTKKDVEAAIYRHAAKYPGEEAVDITKKIRGACCIKYMDPEHYRLVIACLDAEAAAWPGSRPGATCSLDDVRWRR